MSTPAFSISKPRSRAHATWKNMRQNWQVYTLIVIPLAILLYFRYLPIPGISLAFKKHNMLLGLWRSPWEKPLTKYFQEVLRLPAYWKVLRNTLLINLYRLVFQFPVPIILALMMDECRCIPYKRIVQTVSYLPNFLSWLIISSLFSNILALNTGMVNQIISFFGGKQQIFQTDPSKFRSLLVIVDIWASMGWGTIVILAAITAVDPSLHEAALMDGAGKLRRIWHVTLPCIRPTLVVLLILRAGSALSTNTEMVLQFYNALVLETGDVLGTYLYRTGLGKMKFSFSTAAGLMTSLVSMILMLSTDRIAKSLGERGLW